MKSLLVRAGKNRSTRPRMRSTPVTRLRTAFGGWGKPKASSIGSSSRAGGATRPTGREGGAAPPAQKGGGVRGGNPVVCVVVAKTITLVGETPLLEGLVARRNVADRH